MRWRLKVKGAKDPVSVELLEIKDSTFFRFKVGNKEVVLTNPKVFPFSIETNEVEAHFETWNPKEWRGHHDQGFVQVEPLSLDATNQGKSNEIRALMPGRVLKVLVTVGEEVESGKPLLVIEAMKMENEIRAPAQGKIKTIKVNSGQSVESGALLVQFE